MPASKFNGDSAKQFTKYITEASFPNVDRFQQISQTCPSRRLFFGDIIYKILSFLGFYYKLDSVYGQRTALPLQIENELQEIFKKSNVSPSELESMFDALVLAQGSLYPESSILSRLSLGGSSPLPSSVRTFPNSVSTNKILRFSAPRLTYSHAAPQSFIQTGSVGNQIYSRFYVK